MPSITYVPQRDLVGLASEFDTIVHLDAIPAANLGEIESRLLSFGTQSKLADVVNESATKVLVVVPEWIDRTYLHSHLEGLTVDVSIVFIKTPWESVP